MLVFAVGVVVTCMNLGNFRKGRKGGSEGPVGGGMGGRKSKGFGFGGGRRK